MLIKIGNKKPELYKSFLIKADQGLHEQVIKELKLKLKKGTILDMGAGEGALSQRLVDNGFSVIATDVDQLSFKCKDAKFVKLDFNNSRNINKFNHKYKEFFDAIISTEVIEHIENPWEYIRTLKQLLKKNGVLIITTPNTTSWLSRFHFLFTGKFHQFNEADLKYGHISPITSFEINNIIKELNFKDIKIKAAGTLPIIWITNSPRVVFYNFLAILTRPFMINLKDGWCILLICKRN